MKVAEIAPARLEQLNSGLAETGYLSECLAVDFAALLRAVLPDIADAEDAEIKTLQGEGISWRMTLGECDPAIPHAGHHTFFGIWRVPDKSALETLVTSIDASGWHDYFQTLNAGGCGVGLREHLKQLDRNAQAAR
jgi:hypothetical protein